MTSLRRSFLIAGALTAATCLAAFLPSRATGQEVPSEDFLTVLPVGTGDTGRLTLINTSRTRRSVGLETLSTDGDINLAFTGLGGVVELAPGEARRVDYTVTTEQPDLLQPSTIRLGLPGSVHAFMEGTVEGNRVATVFRSRSRAGSSVSLPWEETANSDPGTLRVGVISLADLEIDVTLDLRDASGSITETQMATLPPGQPAAFVFDLGDGPSTGGTRSVEIRSTGILLADGLLQDDEGATFIGNGRAASQNNQFWFPYVNEHGVDVVIGNVTGGPAYSGELRFFDPKGNVLGNVDTFNGNPGFDQNVETSAPQFPALGALCVDIRSGIASRAPATLLRGPGDKAVLDPLRRIAPGQAGVAPFAGEDGDFVANSVILLNNPSNATAVGVVRLRAADGRVLQQRTVKVKSFENAVLPLKKLGKKSPDGVYVELVNPPADQNPKGGGTFQAAVISTKAVVAHPKKAGRGDASQLAALPLLASDSDVAPAFVAASVERADDDKKAFLVLDGLASGLGKKARLRLVGASPAAEWNLKGGKSAVKLKLKAKSLGSKQRLSDLWPVGEGRTFVLIDDTTGEESEPTEIFRGTPPAAEEQ